MNRYDRRDFIRTSIAGGLAAAFLSPSDIMGKAVAKPGYEARVALTSGDDRAEMVFSALKPFSKEISEAVRKKRVILKPNLVSIDKPLCATHVDTLEGILEFFRSIGRTDNIIIAESSAGGPTMDGYSNYGYMALLSRYKFKFIDLDDEPVRTIYVFDEKDFRPHAVRASSLLLDNDSYIVSVARMKTHDRVLATLSLKNIVVGAPVKDKGFAWGPGRKPGTVNDKPLIHGSGFRGINYNLYALSKQLHPHLAVIDGFEGMEGNGPNDGTPVDHRVCVVSTDWLAADRVGVELMGIDFRDIGYLNYCANTGAGVADIAKMEIIGEPIQPHIRKYKLSDNISKQLIWKNPVS